MKMMILEVKGLKTYYDSRRGCVKAVDDVSFNLKRGEVLGIVGESGCGKTTLGLSILRLIRPPGKILKGDVIYDGKINIMKISKEELRKVRWKEISMIFQGAMNALNPVHKIIDQVVEAIVLHEGIEKSEAVERAAKMLQLTGIPLDRMKSYPFELSGGMKQRVVIAMALACNPKIVIADEPTTALDVVVQKGIIDLLTNLKRKLNLSLLFITHDPSILSVVSDRIMVIYAGKIVEIGETRKIIEKPLHPYTQGLFKSILLPLEQSKELISIPGDPPDLVNPPSGCRFHPRCPYKMELCEVEEPLPRSQRDGIVACHLYG
ncbi:MAG: ABC transporter ATP-binding protein [Candidatus Methanomethylicia archaeon]